MIPAPAAAAKNTNIATARYKSEKASVKNGGFFFLVILRDTSPEEAPFKHLASWEKEQILKGPGFCAYQPRQAGIRSVSLIAVLFAASCQRCQVTALIPAAFGYFCPYKSNVKLRCFAPERSEG